MSRPARPWPRTHRLPRRCGQHAAVHPHTRGEHTAALVVDSDAVNANSYQVPLTGSGKAPPTADDQTIEVDEDTP